MHIALIGAGVAGLACADTLRAAGHAVTLFDKGRAAGGRMATRRIATARGEVSFDHGAQYFTVRDPAFRAQVSAWHAAGLAAPWPAAGPAAWVGTPAMNAPAEQAAPLLRPWHAGFAALAAATGSAPCWTVMAAFADRLAYAPDILRDAGPVGWAARTSAKPGRTGPESWVIQATPDWSRAHLEHDPAAIAANLLAAFAAGAGLALPSPLAGSAGDAALWDPALRLGACVDWLLGPRVEAAYLSGVRLAALITAPPASR